MMNIRKKKVWRKGMAFFLALLVLFLGLPAGRLSAKTYITPRSALPAESDVRDLTVTVNNRKGPMQFTIRAQAGFDIPKKSYLAQHGCAVSALTTVLTAYNKNMQVTPV